MFVYKTHKNKKKKSTKTHTNFKQKKNVNFHKKKNKIVIHLFQISSNLVIFVCSFFLNK